MPERPSPDYHAALVKLMQALSASLAEIEEQLRADERPELVLVQDGEPDA
jgi:HPt (histidine-containing phosphotransfer) domain-containing protein